MFKIIRRLVWGFRVALLTGILLIAAVLLWLNQIGLPHFFQNLVVAQLEKQQVYLQVGRIRLDGFTRLLLEDVRFRNSQGQQAAGIEIPLAVVNFSASALLHGRIEVESLHLSDSTITLNLSPTNSPPDLLQVTHVSGEWLLHSEDRWELANVRGDVLGAHLEMSATLTNASTLSRLHWPTHPSVPVTDASLRQKQIQQMIATWKQVQFSTPPNLKLIISADARELGAVTADLHIRAPKATSPWGESDSVRLDAKVGPSEMAGGSDLSLVFRLDELRAHWGRIEHLEIDSSTTYPLKTNALKFQSTWEARAQQVHTPWTRLKKPAIKAATLQKLPHQEAFQSTFSFQGEEFTTPWFTSQTPVLKADLSHHHPWAALNQSIAAIFPSTNALIQSKSQGPTNLFNFWDHNQEWQGDWKLELGLTDGEFGRVQSATMQGNVSRAANTNSSDWDSWTKAFGLRYFQATGSGRAELATAGKFDIQNVSFNADWKPPVLTLHSLRSTLKQGVIQAQAKLDLRDRLIHAGGNAAPYLAGWFGLFPPDILAKLEPLRAAIPPLVQFKAQLQLPRWDAPEEQWQLRHLTNLTVSANLSATNLGYGQFNLPSLKAVALYTNQHLQIPLFELLTHNGALRGSGQLDPKTREYQLNLQSRFDPKALIPLLPSEAESGIKFVEFREPPWIDAAVRGNLSQWNGIQAQGTVRVTNFMARGESIGDFFTLFNYTNQHILLTQLVCHRTQSEVMTAPSVGVDLRDNTLYITNGFSTADPYVITRIIGPLTAAAIARYQFATPPAVNINGKVPYTDIHGTDLYFDVDGGDFRYWRFHTPKITGNVHWQGDRLWITNVHAPFYGGKLTWQGEFTFFPNDEADYSFLGITENMNLSAILRDIAPSTSPIEGTVNGTMHITSANTVSISTWKGNGQMEMRDGFLWSIPVFGSLSELIDSLSPGLGKPRISSGTATYTIDQASVQTKDMEVRAPTFRLKYIGKVGFDGALDARAELEPLRDTPIVGKVFSLAFWPLAKVFQTRVSGTIEAPKTEPVHIPKFLLAPFRPVQTLKELLP